MSAANPYSDALKEAYAAVKKILVLETLEIYHPELETRVRIVKDRVDLVANIENGSTVTFKAGSFLLELPSKTGEGLQDLNIKIANIDDEDGVKLSDFFNNAAKFFDDKVQCIYRPYVPGSMMPQMSPPLTLTITDVVADNYEVNGRASFADLLNKKFPLENYTRSTFPSLGGF